MILLLAGLAAFVFLLDPILARLRSTYTLVVMLPEAPQLATGSRVWVSGRDVGKVTEVGFMPSGSDTTSRIFLHVELPAEVRELVRRDSRVRVTSERMIGEPVIDILPGSASAAVLQPGDTLRVPRRPSPAQVLARARSARLSLDTAVQELQALRAPVAQRLASFDVVQQRLAAAQREYGLLAADLRASPALAALGDGGLQTSLTDARNTLAQLAQAFRSLQERAAAAGVQDGAQRLGATSARLQQTLAELEREMRVQGGTVDRLMRDSALVKALAGARAELDSVIADAKRNPLRYVF